MPNIEVDEGEFQRSNNALKMFNEMWSNKESQEYLLRARKVLHPDDPAVKNIDKPDPRDEQIKTLRDEFAADKKAREDADAERTKNEQISRLKNSWDSEIAELRRNGWQEEGIKQLEKIRDEKGLLNARDCATLFERDHPPPAPIAASGNSWNYADPAVADADENIKKLMESKGDSEAVTNKMINETLHEFRQAHPMAGRR